MGFDICSSLSPYLEGHGFLCANRQLFLCRNHASNEMEFLDTMSIVTTMMLTTILKQHKRKSDQKAAETCAVTAVCTVTNLHFDMSALSRITCPVSVCREHLPILFAKILCPSSSTQYIDLYLSIAFATSTTDFDTRKSRRRPSPTSLSSNSRGYK